MCRRFPMMALAALLAGLASGAAAQTASGGDPHAGRLEFVQRLVEESSGARQVEASANPEAKARHAQARALQHAAHAAHQAGNHAEADRLIKEAITTMIAAIRLAEAGTVTAGKKQRDFAQRSESVEALLAAYRRICEEKHCDPGEEARLRAEVGTKMAAARARLEGGDLDGARALLDEAYVSTKAAIERRRGGDTLVRALHFRDKEEEYRYELDRNETHRLLVRMLLEEKMRNPGVERTVTPLIEEAVRLRAEAEREAQRGAYREAVEKLESSTERLMRAIRSAGIYIPG